MANQNSDIARLVASQLTLFQIPIVAAVGGTVAMAALRAPESKFGAIVLDRGHDGTGGLAVVGELRARGDLTPVVLMSGSGPGALPLPPGVWFVAKPFTPEQLIAAVRAALNATPGEC